MPSSTSRSTRRKTTKTSSRTKSTKSTSKTKAASNSDQTPQTSPSHNTETGLALVCDQTTLSHCLSFVAKAIPTNPTHPMLGNILFVVDKDQQKLTLSSYNLEFGMVVNLDANVTSSGEMSVPHSLFTKIVDKFPQGNLSLTSSRKKLFAEVGNSKPELNGTEQEEAAICAVLSTPIDPDKHFEFFAHNSEDFPSLPKVKTKLVTLPGDQLIAQLSASLFAASSDETKKILNGSQLVFAHDPKKQLISLTTWTTDGHRLVRTQASKECKTKSKLKHLNELVSFVVPIKVLKELARQLNPIDEITIYFEPNSSSQTQAGTVMFEWDNKSLVSRTIEGQYPDCQGIIDVYKPQYNRTFVCNRWFLLKALERFLVLSDKSSQGLSIHLDSRKQKAILSLERHSVGKGTEAVPIQLKGDKLEFLYNVRYLYEIVKATTSLDICFNLTSTTLPTLITPHHTIERGDMAIEVEYILAPMQGGNS